jgi:peroxiredoxin
MRSLITFSTIVLITTSAFAQLKEIPKQNIPPEYGYIVQQGQQVPEFEMTLADGKTVKASELKGKVVMLQFTASWCSVCRKEMPHIEKEIWQKHKANKNFALYGIDLDEPLDKVKKFASDIKITYPLALDPGGKIFYTFAAPKAGVTRNVIIDKNGKIVYLTRLYNKQEFREMKEVIDLLLK